MSIFHKHVLSSFVFGFFILLALASATGKNVPISQEGGQIPPGFGNRSDTLLVFRNSISGIGIGKTFKSAFKNYQGAYKLISKYDEDNYDKSKYRYSIYLGTNPSRVIDANNRPGPGTVSCIMQDRLTGVEYISTGVPNYGKLLKRYVSKLNEILK